MHPQLLGADLDPQFDHVRRGLVALPGAALLETDDGSAWAHASQHRRLRRALAGSRCGGWFVTAEFQGDGS